MFDLLVNVPNKKKISLKKIKIPLIGIHNVRNSVAAIAVAMTIGISKSDIKKGLLNFKGVQRRFNKIFSYNEIDFYDLKGDLESILLFAQVEEKIRFVRSSSSALHPGQSADIFIGDKKCGTLGRLKARIQNELGLREKVFLCEIDLSCLGSRRVVQSKMLSKFPEIRRDLSFIVDEKIEVSEMTLIVKGCSALLKDLIVFDVYQGDNIPENQKSIAISVTIQSSEKTLNEADLEQINNLIIKTVENKTGAKIRS